MPVAARSQLLPEQGAPVTQYFSFTVAMEVSQGFLDLTRFPGSHNVFEVSRGFVAR